MTPASPPAIAALLDGYPVSRQQRVLLGLIMTILVIDGVDVQLLALVAPRIMADFGTGAAGFALALTAALVGTATGNYSGGWLGDRIGRKQILVASIFLFALATTLVGFARGLSEIALLRFAGGIGFGAAVPNGLAFCSEWLPHRAQTSAMSLLAPAVPVGGVIGAGGTLVILAVGGWRECFFVFGSLSLLIALVAALWMPSSPTALIARGEGEAALRELRRMVGQVGALPSVGTATPPMPNKPSIFTAPLMRLNLGASLALLSMGIVTYAMSGWTTTIFADAGMPLAGAIRSILAFNLLAVAGSFLVAGPVNRFGSAGPMAILGTTACGLIVAMAAALRVRLGMPILAVDLTLMLVSGLLGFVSGAIMTTIYSVMAAGYPLDRRASGMGLGLMFGRIGGIVILGFGGWLLAESEKSHTPFYVIIAAASLMTLVASAIINRHLAPCNQYRGPLPATRERAQPRSPNIPRS